MKKETTEHKRAVQTAHTNTQTTRSRKKTPVTRVIKEVLPDGSILDTTTFDIGDNKITEKEKQFVFWYTYPGTDAFQCMARSAKKAGYKNCASTGYKLRQKPNVLAAINHVLDSKLKINMDEAFQKIIELKLKRAFFDLKDFVAPRLRYIERKDQDPLEYTVEDIKDLADLTPEQRACIDGIDYKGQQSVKVYNLANRDKAMADIIDLYQKVNGKSDDNGYDIEMTAEIIKEKLSVKVSSRKKKEEIAKQVDFVDTNALQSEEL